MTAIRTYFANAVETTLLASLGVGATTINVVDTTGFPAVPFYAVLEPANDANREVVLIDSTKTSTTLVMSSSTKRGLDGTSDVAHDSGAAIKVVPVAAALTDIHDLIDALEADVAGAYVPGGTNVAVADGGTGSSTAAGARTNLGLVIGTDVQAYSAVLAATTASFTVADEAKLDGIEAGADVTDAANVAAAGALMDSDLVDDDTFATASATTVPSSESVKAYVGANAGAAIALIHGFSVEPSGTATAQRLYRVLAESTSPKITQMPVVMDRAGSVVGVTVALEDARTAGTLTVEVYKNGAATGLTVTIDGTNTQYHYASQASGLDTFVAGDRLDARVTTSAFAPTSANFCEASITVAFS